MSIDKDADIKRIRILVVDDDPMMLEITVLLLNHHGFLVTPSTCSKEAISKITDEPGGFDAVLTDYDMPVIDGVELAGMIKELSSAPPVILYTGKVDYMDETRLNRMGVTEIAQKPCKIDELGSIIKRAIDKRRTTPGL